ncbi:MAG: bifunctional folylpolyglutamate synthase/dihydrofolate synthase [Magnetococcales bacterium]|nr:bifunctional folylpolyglutamate synthase/dihydrofolate synthase [Magnetococcales bacterium]
MSASPLSALLDQAQAHQTGGIVLGLSRIEQLLAALGNPHSGLPVIHVAGTNGKGSVIAFLEEVLLGAGFRVGRYISPHLVDFNERIQIDQIPVTDRQLIPILERVLGACRSEQIPATFFEITTVAAFCFFSEQRLDKPFEKPQMVLLETGLGGRLDATNVVTPLLCLITAIGLDHGDYLGHTIAQVSHEKAGILKAGVQAVAAPNNRQAEEVIRQQARQRGVDLHLAGESFHFLPPESDNDPWLFIDKNGQLELPPPALLGNHQRENAALAVAALRLLSRRSWPIGDIAIQSGIQKATWPGRLEWIHQISPPILLDGAHNLLAATALALALANMTEENRPRSLIFSALQDKDIPGIVAVLSPLIRQVWTVSVGEYRGVDAETLAGYWQAHQIPTTPCSSVNSALQQARNCPSSHQGILVTGSLYLVGAVRSLLLWPNYVESRKMSAGSANGLKTQKNPGKRNTP